MMKQLNGLLFGEGVLLYDSLTVIVSQLTLLEIEIVLEVCDCFG